MASRSSLAKVSLGLGNSISRSSIFLLRVSTAAGLSALLSKSRILLFFSKKLEICSLLVVSCSGVFSLFYITILIIYYLVKFTILIKKSKLNSS
jgi:hypothetical protein